MLNVKFLITVMCFSLLLLLVGLGVCRVFVPRKGHKTGIPWRTYGLMLKDCVLSPFFFCFKESMKLNRHIDIHLHYFMLESATFRCNSDD